MLIILIQIQILSKTFIEDSLHSCFVILLKRNMLDIHIGSSVYNNANKFEWSSLSVRYFSEILVN